MDLVIPDVNGLDVLRAMGKLQKPITLESLNACLNKLLSETNPIREEVTAC